MRRAGWLVLVGLAACGALRGQPATSGTAPGTTAPRITVLRPGEVPVADGFYLVPAGDASSPLRRRDLDWEPPAGDRQAMYWQLAELAGDGCAAQEVRPVLPRGVPETLVRLTRLDGRYVVYDPCDGITSRYYLTDGFVEQHYYMDGPNLLVVRRAESAGERGFTLEVTRPYHGCAPPYATLRIEPLSSPGWFRVRLENTTEPVDGIYGTPEAAAELDVLVNFCPTAKRREYPFERER
jgi:hypothetical protein